MVTDLGVRHLWNITPSPHISIDIPKMLADYIKLTDSSYTATACFQPARMTTFWSS
jgi:hypothetical protein